MDAVEDALLRRLPPSSPTRGVRVVGDVVPDGFDVTVAVLHDATLDGVRRSWSEIARALGVPDDPPTMWAAVARDGWIAGAPRVNPPRDGTVNARVAARLVPALVYVGGDAGVTFLAWDAYGDPSAPLRWCGTATATACRTGRSRLSFPLLRAARRGVAPPGTERVAP